MRLSILIVNWNTRDQAVKCVNSILRYPPNFDYEVLVVDNHSRDGSADALVNLFGHQKRIRVIESLRNLGFAKGNNLAYQKSFGEYILLLNSDTEVREESLKKIVDYIHFHPEVGVLGPRLLYPDGTVQKSVRRFPGIFSSMVVLAGLHRFITPRAYLMADFNYDQIAEVDQVMGAALLTRRFIIEKLGYLFDERFYLWFEEVDFCRRVKDLGYKIVYYPKAEVVHAGAQSFSQMDVFERKRIAARSLLYYFSKHGNLFEVYLIHIVLPMILFAAKTLDYLQKVFHFRTRPHV